jgi:hypothetical protein
LKLAPQGLNQTAVIVARDEFNTAQASVSQNLFGNYN